MTPWELPSLLTPVYTYRQARRKPGPVRAHFPAVLAFVHRNRFAVASQIQRRFPDAAPSGRTARRHLEQMVAIGLLTTVPTRGVSPLFPKVYQVTGRGVRKLRESLAQRGKAWKATRVDRRGRHTKEGYSADQVLHEILLTEFLLAVRLEAGQREDLDLLGIQRRSLARHPAFELGGGRGKGRLIPDAMFLVRRSGQSGGLMCCLLELDLGTMNRKQIEGKLRRYDAWSRSGPGRQFFTDLYRHHGASNPRPTFRLLVVVRSRSDGNDGKRLEEFRSAAAGLSDAMRRRVWLTTVTALREEGENLSPLESPLWGRVPGEEVGTRLFAGTRSAA